MFKSKLFSSLSLATTQSGVATPDLLKTVLTDLHSGLTNIYFSKPLASPFEVAQEALRSQEQEQEQKQEQEQGARTGGGGGEAQEYPVALSGRRASKT